MSTMQRGCFQSALSKQKIKIKTQNTACLCKKSLSEWLFFSVAIRTNIYTLLQIARDWWGDNTKHNRRTQICYLSRKNSKREKSAIPHYFSLGGFFWFVWCFFLLCILFFSMCVLDDLDGRVCIKILLLLICALWQNHCRKKMLKCLWEWAVRLFQGVEHQEMGELGQLLGTFGCVVQLDGVVREGCVWHFYNGHFIFKLWTTLSSWWSPLK